MDPNTWQKDTTPTYLRNPLKHPLELEEFDDTNHKIKIIVPSLEISTFPKYRAEIVKKHLVDAIINDRKLGFVTPEKRAEIEQEVEVSLE